MPDKTLNQSVNFEVRNQVLLERLKEGEHREFLKFSKKMVKSVTARLAEELPTIRTKKRLNAVLSDIKRLQKDVYDDYKGQLILNLSELAAEQAVFEKEVLDLLVVDFDAVLPDVTQLLTAIRIQPLSVAVTSSPLLEPFIKDWSNRATASVNNVVLQGFAQGQTINEMVTELRGTKGANFKDGTVAQINRSQRAVVRTAVQHTATVARHSVMEANDDLIKGYQWVSTLDSRTTDQCTALDGRVFKPNKGPLPPIHIGCRSTTIPVLSSEFDFLDKGGKRASVGAKGGKPVPAKTTYFTWLKTQPVAFQNIAIGKKRAKLLRDGGLTSTEFSRLSLDKNFMPLTLKQMRSKRPDIFKEANVKLNKAGA